MINKESESRLKKEVKNTFLRIKESFGLGTQEVSGDLYEPIDLTNNELVQIFKFAGDEYVLKATLFVISGSIQFETFKRINNFPGKKDTCNLIEEITFIFKPDPQKSDFFLSSF